MTDITARLADALRGMLDSAVFLSRDYLYAFAEWPLDKTIHGWPKARWLDAADEVDAARAILAAYESERVGWQPIETAPKNECVLVLAHKQQFVAWLQDDATDPWLCGAGEESGLDGMWCVTDNKLGPFPLRGGHPTHWMPLPAAPVTP